MLASLIEDSKYIGDGLWQWTVSLSADSQLQDVVEVVYTLHPTYGRPVRKTTNRDDNFAVRDITSSSFTIYARVSFADGSEQLIEKQLELSASDASEAITEVRAKPIIAVVEDGPDVLFLIVRDLRQRYAKKYQLMQFESGVSALESLRKSRQRFRDVALVISDLRMPVLNGMDFLIEVNKIYPGAQRALLTAYADTGQAMRAVNAGVNGYILKPWHPAEKELFPALDKLLNRWWSDRNQSSTSSSLRTTYRSPTSTA